MPKAMAAPIPTPDDLTIVARDRRFSRAGGMRRHWVGGDPFATAFYNALSASLPKAEGFMIASIRQFRDKAPERLQAEIRAFSQQEVLHTREHLAFNRLVSAQGYDVGPLEAEVDRQVARVSRVNRVASLGATAALEHFTACLSHAMLIDPQHLAGADPEAAALWRWHAVEEIEHKGVAYDTWLHATRRWSRHRRWAIKLVVTLAATWVFTSGRAKGMVALLRQDGITGVRAWWGIARFALVRPGLARTLFGDWLRYFAPCFHPWQRDDRALIALADSDYADAVGVAAR